MANVNGRIMSDMGARHHDVAPSDDPGADRGSQWLIDDRAALPPDKAEPLPAQRPVSAAESDLVYWDGGDASKYNNGVVNGGAGTWTATGGTFTRMDGTLNGPLTPGAGPAIFSGQSGVVSIDASAGQVQAPGLGLTSTGYTIGGLQDTAGLTLTGSGGAAPIGVAAGVNATIYSVLTAPNGLEKTGAGSVTLGSLPASAASLTISEGRVTLGNSSRSASGQVNIVDNAELAFGNRFAVTISGAISGTGNIIVDTGFATGTVTFTAAITTTGTLTNMFRTTIGNGGTAGSVSGNIVNGSGGEFYFNRSDTYSYAGNISGGAVYIANGGVIATGNWTTSLASTSAGTTLQIGNGGTTGAISGAISGSGALSFNRSDTYTTSATVTGSGSLTQAGAGTLILTGANSYTGGTTISAGTLQIGNGTASGAITGAIVDNAALVFNPAGTYSTSANISGTGSLTKIGAGTLALSGTTYAHSGGTTVSAGTLQIGNATSLSFSGNILDDAALVFAQTAGSLTYAGTISGTGSVTKQGAGTLTLSGASSFAGGTTIAAGTLSLTAVGSAGSGAITFGSGAQTLAIAGAAFGADHVFANQINGFAADGDRIDLTGIAAAIAAARYDAASGTLTVTHRATGSLLASLQIAGAGAYGFALTDDGAGGSLVSLITAGSGGVNGTAGGDSFAGSSGDDLFNLSQGGADFAFGGGGDDGFFFGGALTAADSVDGGAGGRDQVGLQGDYAAGLTLGTDTFVGIENLVLLSGADTRFGESGANRYSYGITTVDGNVAAGQVLVVNANTLLGTEAFTFNGSAELDGAFMTYGGVGVDTIIGGQQSDGFFFGDGRWGAGDSVDGRGGGLDQLGFQGNYAGANAITFGAGQLTSIENLVLLSGTTTQFGGGGASFSYDLTLVDANVAAGASFTVSANQLAAGETLTLTASAESDAALTVYGGAGNDVLSLGALGDTVSGGGGADRITGNGGADQLTGGAGNDVFAYLLVSDSTAAVQDHILDFASGDRIDLSAVDGNDAAGVQQFTFIGSAPFTAAGQLHAVNVAGNDWLVEGDTDGNGAADFSILVTSDHAITAADFIGVQTGGGGQATFAAAADHALSIPPAGQPWG